MINIVSRNTAVHRGKVYVYAASDHVGLTSDQARTFAVKLIEAAAVADAQGDGGRFGWSMTL